MKTADKIDGQHPRVSRSPVSRRSPRRPWTASATGLRVVAAALALLTPALLPSCGGDSGTEPGGTLAISPSTALAVGVGDGVQFTAHRIAPDGGSYPAPAGVTWVSGDPTVAEVSSTGRATAVGPGETTIQASASGLGSASATLEVYVPPVIPEYEPGVAYSGRRGYIEYRPGSLPIILSAPHGGALLPDEIPDRTYGVTGVDTNTLDLAVAVSDALADATGQRPHLVVSHLRRLKLDPNREIEEAAQGSTAAELAWSEYHGFVDTASETVEAVHGSGLYLDIHGHRHSIQRIELGYLLGGSTLDLSDAALNDPAYAVGSSIRSLASVSPLPFADLLRGPDGFGSLLQDEGYRAVPSQSDPGPSGAPYFSGGYSTARHGSRDGGTVDGIQLEHYHSGIRDTPENRATYAAALARVILAYMNTHHPAGAEFR